MCACKVDFEGLEKVAEVQFLDGVTWFFRIILWDKVACFSAESDGHTEIVQAIEEFSNCCINFKDIIVMIPAANFPVNGICNLDS